MILITGATGLLGSHLLYQLTSEGKKVRALRRSSSSLEGVQRLFTLLGDDGTAWVRVQWVEGDVLDVTSLYEATEGVQQVYHCAAAVSFQAADREMLQKVNVEGTANVVNACLGRGGIRLCHVSSVAALGRDGSSDLISEETVWTDSEHNSNYAKSKRAGELEVWRGVEEGLDAFIVNPCILIGVGPDSGSSAELFSRIDKGFRFYGRGMNAFADVRDAARIMRLLMEKGAGAERYIIAAENVSYRHIFDLMADALGRKKPDIEVKPWMTAIFWRLAAAASLFTGKPPFITKESAHNAVNTFGYDNRKLLAALPGVRYTPIPKTVSDMAGLYRKMSPS